MILCIDVGNTHIVCGVFSDKKLILHSRYATEQIGTADQFGIFLRTIFKENNIDYKKIKAVSVSSVVPSCNFTLHHAISQYLPQATYFMLDSDTKTGLNIKYKNPAEIGADLLAGAIGACSIFPSKNLIIVDLGTATTITAIENGQDFLGGVIIPGMKLAMESLTLNAARLTEVNIEVPNNVLGQSTTECIQSGLYHGHLGAIKEIIGGYKQELFIDKPVTVIATGGFAQLFKDKQVFDEIIPDLVLQGLRIAYGSL